MSEWLGHVITGLSTLLAGGGLAAAWFKYRLDRLSVEAARQAAQAVTHRAARKDEIDVMQSALAQAEQRFEDLRKELYHRDEICEQRVTIRDEQINKLSSECTATKIVQARLEEQNRNLLRRVEELEAEVAELRAVGADRGTTAGGR